MDEKNELNNIILNKGASSAGNKKIILAVATLGVVLIVVVMLMNTLTSTGTDNLPQAALPPEPQKQTVKSVEEPLFEEVKVVEESSQENASLDKIAQKLKEESKKESTQTIVQKSTPTTVEKPNKIAEKRETVEPQPTKTTTSSSDYYIQVGSFAKYAPNKKFLDSILKLGYKYKFHKVTIKSKELNKVLVGPFHNEAEARKALRSIRSSVEAGAFLTKI